MLEDSFLELMDSTLKPLGHREEDGEEFRDPPLDVLRYYQRPVRLHWLPMIGRAQAVVAIVRQPLDVGLTGASKDYKELLTRLAMAVNSRFPPGRRLGWGSVGLSVVVLTPEPIGGDDDTHLKAALEAPNRSRVVRLGVLRVNLGQEALAFQLADSSEGLFPEPAALADALTLCFRRFVPFFQG